MRATPSPLRKQLLSQTITQLRRQCRDYGLHGHYRRGVRKSQIVTILVDHLIKEGLSVELSSDEEKEKEPPFEKVLPPEMLASIAQYTDDRTFHAILQVSKSTQWYVEIQRRERRHAHVCRCLKTSVHAYQLGLFLPGNKPLRQRALRKLEDLTPQDYDRLSPPTEEMILACADKYIGYYVMDRLTKLGCMTKKIWIQILTRDPNLYTRTYGTKSKRVLPAEYHADEDIQLAVVAKKVSHIFQHFPQPVSQRVIVAAAYHNWRVVLQLTSDQITDDVVVGAMVQGGLGCTYRPLLDRVTVELKHRINVIRGAMGKQLLYLPIG